MQTLPLLPEKEPKQFKAFRNIYTIKSSQSLFDDLTNEEDEILLLQALENQTSGINHQQGQKDRVFQYGASKETLAVFEKINWHPGRFGNGQDYGVWYGALEKDTSIQETLYWSHYFIKEDLASSHQPITVDRKMLEAHLQTDTAIDLRALEPIYPELTHKTDYAFCHMLGNYAQKHAIALYLTPSVRRKNGTCVPVFSPQAIKKDRTLFYFHFTFFKDGRICMTTDKDEWVSCNPL